MSKFKAVCIGDVHINDWSAYATYDEHGRPSRLVDYLDLAYDIKKFGKSHKAKDVFIAGDFLESAVQRPQVLDIAGQFLDILSDFNVWIIPGQHDMDTKVPAIVQHNCVLTDLCRHRKHVHYFSQPEVVQVGKDLRILFNPWNPSHSILDEPADIFVGHGIVEGSSNLEGYMFKNGFLKEDLHSRFKLSIIGDIHNGQTFEDKKAKSKILIPGSPIQFNWKDNPNCGIWLAEYEDGKMPKLTYANIHELHPDKYHQFRFAEEGEDAESTNLVHYRTRIRSTFKADVPEKISDHETVSVIEVAQRVLDEAKLEDKEYTKEVLNKCFDEVEYKEKDPVARSIIRKVYIKGFMSVDKLLIDMDEFERSCVLVGSTGSGKTAIPEAIFWCLTGETTKGVSSSDVCNWYVDDGCEVSVLVDVYDQTYKITRWRSPGPGLKIEQKNGTRFTEYRRSSINETQNEIYKILGLNKDQIRMFSYFSAEGAVLFSRLGGAARNDLMAKLVGVDIVYALCEHAKARRGEVSDRSSEISGSLKVLEDRLLSNKSRLDEINSSMNDNNSQKAIQLQTEIESEEAKLKELQDRLKIIAGDNRAVSRLNAKIATLTQKISELERAARDSRVSSDSLKQKIADVKSRLAEAQQGRCPTCKQKFAESEELANDLSNMIQSYLKELKSITDPKIFENNAAGFRDALQKSKKAQQEIYDIENKIRNQETRIRTMRAELLAMDTKVDTSLIEHLEAQIKDDIKRIRELKDEKNKVDREYEVYNWLATKMFNRTGSLVKELNKIGASVLQAEISRLLEDSPVEIELSETLEVSASFVGRKKASYLSLSNGQRRVVDTSIMVGLNNLFSREYNLSNGVLGLVIFDEILSFLSPEYVDLCRDMLDRCVSNKILVITHDDRLAASFDYVINVNLDKKSKMSQYDKSWKVAA